MNSPMLHTYTHQEILRSAEVWAGGWQGTTGGGVSGLVGGLLTRRQMLVEMVRDTQTFFSPVLQCYFASTVRVPL